MKNALLLIAAVTLLFTACKETSTGTGTGTGETESAENPPTPAASSTAVASPRTLTINTEAGSVTFQVPPDLELHSAEDEPMDWNYALVEPAAGFDFGIRAEPMKPGADEADLQAAYLASVLRMHDPKITSRPAPEPLPGNLYESAYWGVRLVAIIPGEKVNVTMEFNSRSLETLQQRASLINAVVASVREE